jgi:hypothetical protein
MAKVRQTLKAWVVTVDMGLGHQRATYPLRHLAQGGIMVEGSSTTSDPGEKKLWDRLRHTYEFLSRVRSVPIVGKPLFGMLDALQNIPSFYPIRDMSSPSFQVGLVERFIDRGLGRRMVQTIKEQPLPLVTSYLVPALAADKAGYGRVYCIICDAEISRAWVANNPRTSRIHYLAPCGRAVMRLKSYGVPDERIFLTGFPFPRELLGNRDLDLLCADMAQRLFYLDPNERFWPLHGRSVMHFLGRANCHFKKERVLTLTYAVGGAGAQREIGEQIIRSLRKRINKGEIAVNLVAGVREEVKSFFEHVKAELVPRAKNVRIIYSQSKEQYFHLSAEVLRSTDILWTKPSEMSFCCGLGIPIIMAPPIGAQELYNRRWLLEVQAGIPQEDPDYTDQWLMDLWQEGRLAESAWDGFLKARKYGTYKIEEVLETGTMARETSPLKR